MRMYTKKTMNILLTVLQNMFNLFLSAKAKKLYIQFRIMRNYL